MSSTAASRRLKWRTFQPHIVVLDLLIPDLNGLQIAAALKQQPW